LNGEEKRSMVIDLSSNLTISALQHAQEGRQYFQSLINHLASDANNRIDVYSTDFFYLKSTSKQTFCEGNDRESLNVLNESKTTSMSSIATLSNFQIV
jgi:hypothetical protein